MIRLLLGILMCLSGTFMYYIGETSNILHIPSNKLYKSLMGLPIGFFAFFLHFSLLQSLLTIASYFIALQFGYGSNNWLTKLVGNKGALAICGFLMGVASFPILGWFSILQGIVSSATFLCIDAYKEKIVEPWVATIRGVLGTICLL